MKKYILLFFLMFCQIASAMDISTQDNAITFSTRYHVMDCAGSFIGRMVVQEPDNSYFILNNSFYNATIEQTQASYPYPPSVYGSFNGTFLIPKEWTAGSHKLIADVGYRCVSDGINTVHWWGDIFDSADFTVPGNIIDNSWNWTYRYYANWNMPDFEEHMKEGAYDNGWIKINTPVENNAYFRKTFYVDEITNLNFKFSINNPYGWGDWQKLGPDNYGECYLNGIKFGVPPEKINLMIFHNT